MRKIIIFILFIISVFVINAAFYFISDDYRFFLKKIKNGDDIVYEVNKPVNDNFSIENPDSTTVVESNTIDSLSFFPLAEKKEESKVILWKNYQNILSLFSKYDLKKIELNSNLFDLTNEYPDDYFEYYSKDLTLYFFPTKKYNEVYDIFHVLKFELPIELNKVNNFWEGSFYINLEKDIQDRFIRLVIVENGVVFGLKIKKDIYNEVKTTLDTMKK